ncbi:helix-turn-helix domain-containing protein [Brevibacillus daliensis]|uniref:helix-turn-helix domain-containing protein n=1 Tax=Brevibacillus daliensis TaxID=2892995 RepID=UPI001E32093E|nr:helix-turn-helix transcriptional regulator [Brevibacillus daliensis]
MESVGQRIKALRKQKKWTQQKLASQVKVSAQVISNWEREYTNPGHDDLSRLAMTLGVSADYILFGQQPNEAQSAKTNTTSTSLTSLFFYELEQLSEEDKQKALEHVKFLRYLAEQKNDYN